MLDDEQHSLVDTLNRQGQKRILKWLVRRQTLKAKFQSTYSINMIFCLLSYRAQLLFKVISCLQRKIQTGNIMSSGLLGACFLHCACLNL